jgi:putative addiction module component (TIGR02574 family)
MIPVRYLTMQDKSSILQAALSLSEEDRLDLAESLFASLPEDLVATSDEAWDQELRRRADQLEAGAVTPVTWDAMKQWVREQRDA